MTETPHKLSKSKFVKGCQCVKALYLDKFHPELKDPVTEDKKALFKRGNEVGKLAQRLFPGGINVKANINKSNFRRNVTYGTNQLISEGEEILYEAGFEHEGVLIMSDVIQKQEDGRFKAYEVKMSTRVKDYHIQDTAIQYYVLKNNGIDINDFSLILIDTDYIRDGELEPEKLFRVESVLKQVEDMQEEVQEKLKEFNQYLSRSETPDVDIGKHCHDPYDCDFLGHCWEHIPEKSVFDVYRMHKSQSFGLYRDGILQLTDIPENTSLNWRQELQVQLHKENRERINKEGIKEFLDRLEYPLYFLDFETINPPIPYYDKSRPYQQIPFQYSLHVKETPDDEVKHFEFVADPEGDPRPHLIVKLLDEIGPEGNIIAYHKYFEERVLGEIAQYFPQYEEDIDPLLNRFIDLKDPFKSMNYYTPEMNGSFSLKAVLPALIPEMSYEKLDIQEGGMASLAFEEMIDSRDERRMDILREQLLEYCKQDTLALVKLLNKLEDTIS